MHSLRESDAVSVAAFLFALGLRHCKSPAIDFIRESFGCVHSAAARDNLDYEHWRPIESVARPLAWWKEWDKCERLRAAVVDKFITCDWPGGELLKAVRTAETLRDFFWLSNTTQDRKWFLRNVAKVGLRMNLLPEYRRILEKCK
jgi:hypothetical protein